MKYNGFLIFAALLRICFSNLRKAEAYELYLHRTSVGRAMARCGVCIPKGTFEPKEYYSFE